MKQQKSPAPDYSWFDHSRYGMFIHWGAYSVAARGEWARNRERIPADEYSRLYAENFHAENYNPASWAALAREAGMGYMVITTRHHDGFALWPTRTGDFHAGRIGPKRDLLKPFVEAARAAGLKVGFYYSPADWRHPDYPGPWFRDWPGVNDWQSNEARARMIAYYREQLVELMTGYGKIDYLWYDGCIPSDLASPEINAEMLRLQPGMLINERNGAPWHVRISEQAINPPKEWGIRWEACMTLNDNWGWHAGDMNWKSAREVVKMLCETAAGGGNLLLNVGPRPDGTIPEESARILREAGAWMRRNGAAIHGCGRSPFTWNNWGRVTVNGNLVYLHIRNSTGRELCWAELKNKVIAARWLADGAPVVFEQKGERLFLRDLPVPLPDPISSTIELVVEGTPEPLTCQTTFWIPGEPAS
ncbi:MAG: alpha-L-fucosidase [Opitutaceae bacterium]|jgi:alpha-L-fucosidase|nr:alpha-L-fucosidase [Opitutaceae bacterium]